MNTLVAIQTVVSMITTGVTATLVTTPIRLVHTTTSHQSQMNHGVQVGVTTLLLPIHHGIQGQVLQVPTQVQVVLVGVQALADLLTILVVAQVLAHLIPVDGNVWQAYYSLQFKQEGLLGQA
jgi:hypothetical protein